MTNADKPQHPSQVKGLSVLSNMGTIPTVDVTFSDGVCRIWVGFVIYDRDLSNMGSYILRYCDEIRRK